jgi:molybdopterin converting factor small subunit
MPESGRKKILSLILNKEDGNMSIQIILFGRLCDITGTNSLVFEDVLDTNELQEQLQQKYPGFAASAYIIAVDEELIHGNTSLAGNKVVALLPPFSGG